MALQPQNERPFGFRVKLGYLFGDFGNDFTFIFAGSYLTLFYTDVLGVAQGWWACCSWWRAAWTRSRTWAWAVWWIRFRRPAAAGSGRGSCACACPWRWPAC